MPVRAVFFQILNLIPKQGYDLGFVDGLEIKAVFQNKLFSAGLVGHGGLLSVAVVMANNVLPYGAMMLPLYGKRCFDTRK
jgi:hypothetical protein